MFRWRVWLAPADLRRVAKGGENNAARGKREAPSRDPQEPRDEDRHTQSRRLRDRADVERAAQNGFDAVLVGETFVTAPDVVRTVHEFATVERRRA